MCVSMYSDRSINTNAAGRGSLLPTLQHTYPNKNDFLSKKKKNEKKKTKFGSLWYHISFDLKNQGSRCSIGLGCCCCCYFDVARGAKCLTVLVMRAFPFRIAIQHCARPMERGGLEAAAPLHYTNNKTIQSGIQKCAVQLQLKLCQK